MTFCFHPSIYDAPTIEPWQPRALSKSEWPPDYKGVYAWRIEKLAVLESDPIALAAAKAYYAQPQNASEFIIHWLDTYDPRRDDIKWLPFVPFEKQKDYLDFLLSCYLDEESGLVEKARDMGATWLSVGFTIWAWLFVKDIAIGWGSRKQELVDRIGDASSIFEKLRQLVDRLPNVFKPKGFNPTKHATFMKLINPANGATVIGEVGDNIGRGGRTKMYFKDESAHYEHPEAIQAALDDNTRIQIDISSVAGLGNVFHRKREAGIDWPGRQLGYTRVFIFDWSDHPEKTQAWYKQRRDKSEREGMLHLFAQEVERNYSASLVGTIIPMEWIIAARDAHLKIDGMRGGARHGGFDVADEGNDRNAFCEIDGVVLDFCEEWGARDPGVSARKVIGHFAGMVPRATVYYDSIGMGASVKAEFNRLADDKEINLPELIGWNAGAAVNSPYARVIEEDIESPLNKDFFANFKAQAWWSLRTRFLKTWQRVAQGVMHPPEQLISVNTANPLYLKLEKELAQPTMTRDSKLRMLIDKKPDGTMSPNLADCAVMGYFPPDALNIGVLIGR